MISFDIAIGSYSSSGCPDFQGYSVRARRAIQTQRRRKGQVAVEPLHVTYRGG